jgi:hypothetical protein
MAAARCAPWRDGREGQPRTPSRVPPRDALVHRLESQAFAAANRGGKTSNPSSPAYGVFSKVEADDWAIGWREK